MEKILFLILKNDSKWGRFYSFSLNQVLIYNNTHIYD